MRRPTKIILVAAAALPTVLGLLPVVSASSAAGATGLEVERVSGADRYATAAAIADAGWPSTLPPGSTVLLATGGTYPDAVAGAAAAAHLRVPLLLTGSDKLSPSTANEIARLKPANVALLGGTSAISDAVAAQVSDLGPKVVRWQGGDRFATAAAVSKATYPDGAINVYLATGRAFPDALAGAALAGAAGGPLLLTDSDSLPQPTADEIARLHPSAIVVLGGPSAVSDAVAEAAVEAAGGALRSRIQGADRYQTADAVASVLVSLRGGSTATKGVLLATGYSFADALAGAAWGGASGRPLLLAPRSFVMPKTWETISTLQAPSVTVLGGSQAITGDVYSGLAAGSPPTK